MGVSYSKLEDDKALLLCRDRKRFVRQALDGRCSLAAAHITYIQSLRNTGAALRKFAEPEAPVESSLNTSTSETPEPLASTEKSLSQFSYSSPSMSQHVDPMESLSPTPSPPYPARFHVSYMKAGVTSSTTVEERPPISVSATIISSSGTLKDSKFQPPFGSPSFDPHSPESGTPPWDYFGLFHPIDHQISFQSGRGISQGLDNADDIKRLREEEGIPDLEDEEKSNGTPYDGDYSDSEDDFDEASSVPLVQSYERRADILDSFSLTSSATQPARNIDEEEKQLNASKNILRDEMDEVSETEAPVMTPSKKAAQVVPLLLCEKKGSGKEPNSENKLAPKDFLSSIKEIECLFIKASESGKEVPRMLEANNQTFRPMFPQRKVQRLRPSMFLSACLFCMEDPEQAPHVADADPPENGMKYLAWHRSTSSRSSSSMNPLGAASKDDNLDSGSNLFNSFCMNSGSHASTLHRLYAWERKLYDEVKASGIIRRDYDVKCKLLRHQDSKGESPSKIDKTRAIVKDLHSRIRVSIQRIDSISKNIEELRDKELQPQLEELIEGLRRMWATMLECHKLQFTIISIAYNNESSKFSLHSESHRQVTEQLAYELNSLCSSFTKWIGAQKSYLQALNSWLLKCVFPLRQKTSRRNNVEFCPWRTLAPPIFVTCRDWQKMLKELPVQEVVEGIKGVLAVTTHFLPRQDKTKRKNLSSTFSLQAEHINETASDILRNETQVDWKSGFENLQSSFIVFFQRLNNFTDLSLRKYVELEDSIQEAKQAYEHGGVRTQM